MPSTVMPACADVPTAATASAATSMFFKIFPPRNLHHKKFIGSWIKRGSNRLPLTREPVEFSA
jgi:hypothetical protein